MRTVNVGILGCGHVGGALVELLWEQHDSIAARTGVDLQVAGVAVRSLSKQRAVAIPAELFTTDPTSVVNDPGIDVVVEVIGGIEPARELILAALAAGKPVITANKELLANHGAELYAAAAEARVDLLFEAAVAGAIPLMRPLRESLIGEPISRIMGIVNGTTNYILTAMSEQGASYHDALAEAQSLGYAERDPTADVEGFDAAAKTAIIATIAYGAIVVAGDVFREGISGVSPADIAFARRLGYAVKMIAIAELVGGQGDAASSKAPEVAVRVHPAMVPLSHPLASVRDSFNAVFIEGGAVGELMLYGRGAGGRPTASAVLGDLIDAAVNQHGGGASIIGDLPRARIRVIDDIQTAFYINLEVADQAGVLAQVASVFGAHNVSIRSMEQEGLGTDARLIFITHMAREADVQATLADLQDLDAVGSIGGLLRVVGD